MSKRPSILLTITVLGICLVQLAVQMIEEKANTGNGTIIQRGMFEWTEEAVYKPEEALELIETLKITRWYQEIGAELEKEAIEAFVKLLHEKEIEVYALLGSVEWGYEEGGETLITNLSLISKYNETVCEDGKFDGVMLDIEPYISERWKQEPEKYMEIYVSCMKNGYLFAKRNGLRTAICIPRHYDDQGLNAGLEKLISKTCDEVAVMNYGCGNEIEMIQTEADLAKTYGKELHCILEFQEVGKHGLTENETYRNKGPDAAERVWNKMQEEFLEIGVIRDYHWSSPMREILEEKHED